MNGLKLMLLLLSLILLIAIWYFLYKIIYVKTIENFVNGSNIIKFDLLMDVGKATTLDDNIWPSVSGDLGNYFQIHQNYNQIVKNTNTITNIPINDIYTYIIYISSTCNAKSAYNLFNLFSTSSLNNYITFNKNTLNTVKYITSSNNIKLVNCFSIGFLKNDIDCSLYIDSVIIATNNIDITNISFFYCDSSYDDIIYSSEKGICMPINFTYNSSSIGNVYIYTFTFTTYNASSGIFTTPLYKKIIININQDNFNLYYINVKGLTRQNYALKYQESQLKLAIDARNSQQASDSEIILHGSGINSAPPDTSEDIYMDPNTNDLPDTTFDATILSDNFLRICRQYMPWGIYNGPDIITSCGKVVLKDLYGREYRHATILDPNNELQNYNNSILTDDTYYSGYDENGNIISVKTNIQYLKGSPSLQILFPFGSLPRTYTICAITKYTGQSNKQRIITSKIYNNDVDFLIGHWSGRNKVMKNKKWKGKDEITGNIKDTNNWLVSCVKTSGYMNTKIPNNKNYNNILYNGEPSGLEPVIGTIDNIPFDPNQDSANDYILTINGLSNQKSDFGLSYLIIWDRIISDADLNLVSKNLIYYLNSNNYQLPLLNDSMFIPNDGLSELTAAPDAITINRITKNTANGYYYIKMTDSKNNQIIEKVYCLLDNVGKYRMLSDNNPNPYGGGWMLAMKGGYEQNTFNFESTHWTTYTTKPPININNTNILNDITTEIKTNIFNYYKFKEILVIYNDPFRFKNIDNNNYYLRSYYKLQNNYDLSLADFFKQNICDFIYCNSENRKITSDQIRETYSSKSTMTRISYYNNYDNFDRNYITNVDGLNFKTNYFSQQISVKVIGLNLNFKSQLGRPHYVRFGAAYNENGGVDMTSIDVSAGVGLSLGYSAGNMSVCCQSSGPANYSTSYPFLLFVR